MVNARSMPDCGPRRGGGGHGNTRGGLDADVDQLHGFDTEDGSGDTGPGAHDNTRGGLGSNTGGGSVVYTGGGLGGCTGRGTGGNTGGAAPAVRNRPVRTVRMAGGSGAAADYCANTGGTPASYNTGGVSSLDGVEGRRALANSGCAPASYNTGGVSGLDGVEGRRALAVLTARAAADSLEATLLALCGQSQRFALALYWLLNAQV